MKQTSIRAYETLIPLLGSYLAINSFFNSSLYNTIASGIAQFLRLFQIRTISSKQVSTIIPLLVTLLVSFLIAYDYIMGKPENMINIYQLNLLLVTPEILSYNRLDWLNLIQKPHILEPTRNPVSVFLSGAIILVGYLSLYFTSKSRTTGKKLTMRGVDKNRINHVFMRQSLWSIKLTLASALVSTIVFISIDPLNNILHSLIGVKPYNYLIFGVPGVLLLLYSIKFYFREQEKGNK
jgi:hypothetical protein